MGIFSLFKLNVKKMILKDQEEGFHLGRDKLISMGKSAVEPLIQALKNQVYYRDDLTIGENRNYYDALSVQREAALILGVIGDERAVEPLIQALKDKDWDFRNNAATALGNIGDERAVEPLIQALRDEDFNHRINAAMALGKIGDARAAQPLILALRDDYLREYAVEALRNIEDARVVEPLIQALKTHATHADYKNIQVADSVRIEAATILGEIRDARAVEPLIQALKDVEYKYSRRSAACALGKIGDARAVEPLIQALKDKNWDFQENAAYALGKIGDARVVEPLIHALKNDDKWQVHENAAMALVNIGDKRAAEAVMSWLFKVHYPLDHHPFYSFGDIKSMGNTPRLSQVLSCPPEGDQKISPESREILQRHAGLKMENLFCSYTDIIINAIIFEYYCHGDDSYSTYAYLPNFEAIKKLCKIHTQISNNILHQILQVRDMKAAISRGDCSGDGTYGILSFEAFRKIAREELERRGNPPYNPSAYLDDKAWKL